jgi:hypothetical protein
MSKVPSLKDILNDIQDDVSDSDEGEFEEIVPQVVQKKPLLDIPDEYRVLNKPKMEKNNNNQIEYNNKQQYNNYNKNSYNQNLYNNNIKKTNIIPLTEANLAQVNNEPLISYDIPKYESIETKSIKSKKSYKSEYSGRSEKSHKSSKSYKSSVSSIDFSVGEDNQNRHIRYDNEVSDDDDRRSQISSLSAGSIKSQNFKNIVPIKEKVRNYDEESVVSKISKKSHISISSMSSLDSNISKKSIQSKESKKSEKPLIQSLYPKKMEPNPMAFDKFSNQNKGEEEKAKVDIKRIKNIDEFKAKVNRYIALDDEISALMEGLRARKKEKQEYEKELLNFMKDNQIDSIKSKNDNSQIELISRKKSETLNKDYLMNCLTDLLKNKSTAENITNYVYNKRGIIEIDKIKRVKEGKKKKDKY